MKFSMRRPVKIVQLGVGGTGGHIAPHMYRLLYALERRARYIIIDGDRVEIKNLLRQNFIRADLGENKARVTAERYSTAFGLETEYVPEFIENEERLRLLTKPADEHFRDPRIQEMVILIGALDNNKSRALCHCVFNSSKELIYIDSGNGEYTGQVIRGVRRAGKTLYKPVGSMYPEVLKDNDLFPTELSCADAAVSAPQAVTANIMAAAAVVNLVYNILVLGDNEVRKITFSTKSISLRPEISKRRKSA